VITTIIQIIIIIVILFAASPFSVTEAILNSLIDFINVIFILLAGLVNALIQVILGVVYGAINLFVGGLYNTLTAWLPLDDWVNITISDDVLWSFTLEHVDFVAAGFNTSLSPIGMFLNTIVQDPMISNIIGGVGLGALVILVLYVLWKAR
jgi:hypothetical protein